MTNEVAKVTHKPGLGDMFIQAGIAMQRMGNSTSMIRAAYNSSCFGMGGCGGFFPVPGLDASDVMARNALMNMDKMGANGSIWGNSGSTQTDGSTFGSTGSSSASVTPLGELNYEKIKTLAAKEKEIKDKEEELKKEKEKDSKSEKAKQLAKELGELRSEYRKLDREYGKGSQLSKAFGNKEFGFYSNLSEEEFKQIQEMHTEISELKKEIAKLETEKAKIDEQVINKRMQMGSKMFGVMPSDAEIVKQFPKETQEKIQTLKSQYDDKVAELDRKTKELKDFIASAAKNTDSQDRYLIAERTEEDNRKAEGQKAAKNIKEGIKNNMYKDDKKQSVSDIIEAVSGQTGYEADTVRPVVELFHSVAPENSSEISGKLNSKEFFDKIMQPEGIYTKPEQLKLAQELYEEYHGAGKFLKHAKNHLGVNCKLLKDALTPKAAASASSPTDKGKQTSTTASDGVPEISQMTQEQKNSPAFIKEQFSVVDDDRIKEIMESLKDRSAIQAVIRDLNDGEVIAVFASSDNAETVISTCYSGGNDYDTAKVLCERLNKIAKKLELKGRIRAIKRTWGSNTVEFINKTDKGEEVNAETWSSTFAACAQCFGVTDTVAPAIHKAAVAMRNKLASIQ